MNRLPLGAFLLIPFVLACFALLPQARAVCRDGCGTANDGNTFQGEDALLNNAGFFNTAIGSGALLFNTTTGDNTAIGYQALYNNNGYDNTGVGMDTLYGNTTGGFNTAIGNAALYANTTGAHNTATGDVALFNNTTGFDNTAIGDSALTKNTTGAQNTAVGFDAMLHNGRGSNNIALGYQAGFNLNGSSNIDIGNKGVSDEAGTIRIGTTGTQINTYVAGISGATVPTGVAVIVDSSGHLGTTTSSARYKEAIKPMDKTSEAILALKPVTFRYKHDLDPAGVPQFGLVAEEVEKVNPDLVARDSEGKPYTVRYEAVNAMLLNEFLKEHKAFVEEQRKVQELEAKLAKQEKDFTARLQEQDAKIQQVSAQLELSKSAPQTVLK